MNRQRPYFTSALALVVLVACEGRPVPSKKTDPGGRRTHDLDMRELGPDQSGAAARDQARGRNRQVDLPGGQQSDVLFRDDHQRSDWQLEGQRKDLPE